MENDKIILERVPIKDVLHPCKGCFFSKLESCEFISENFPCADENGIEYIWELKNEIANS